MTIKVHSTGNFKNLESLLDRIMNFNQNGILHEYGRKGVDILASATPVDTGQTADSWGYVITKTKRSVKLTFTNSNVVGVNSIPVVILLQYGHATKGGAWVEGIDFLNPATQEIFEEFSEALWSDLINK